MPRGGQRAGGDPHGQKKVKKSSDKKATTRVKALSFDQATRVQLEDELREAPFFCAPRFNDVEAWAAAMVDKENVQLLLEAYQEEMKIPNDCSASELRRWLQKWVSRLKSKDKWISEVSAAMKNPDQVPQGKESGHLRKAAVHQGVLSQEVCNELLKRLPMKEFSTKQGTPQLDTTGLKSFLLKKTKASHKKVLALLEQNDFESKLKKLVLEEVLKLQRSKMDLRMIGEDEIKVKLFVNTYEPGPQESTGKGGKKRKREVVKNNAVSGLEVHTDSSGVAAVVVSLTGDGGSPGLYWIRDKELGKGEKRLMEQFQLPLEVGDAALIHRGCIHGVHFAVRSVRRITLNAFFFVQTPTSIQIN